MFENIDMTTRVRIGNREYDLYELNKKLDENKAEFTRLIQETLNNPPPKE